MTTGFLTPLAGLALTTPRANTLLPVRILGRNEASQPWRLLAQTVVYRLADAGGEAVNPPVALHGASARWLRVEASNGADLGRRAAESHCRVRAAATGFRGHRRWAVPAGRRPCAQQAEAALPLATITSALGTRESSRTCRPLRSAPPSEPRRKAGLLARFLPGAVPGKTAVLWGVLLAGVLLLAGGGVVPAAAAQDLKSSTMACRSQRLPGSASKAPAPVQRHREVALRERGSTMA